MGAPAVLLTNELSNEAGDFCCSPPCCKTLGSCRTCLCAARSIPACGFNAWPVDTWNGCHEFTGQMDILLFFPPKYGISLRNRQQGARLFKCPTRLSTTTRTENALGIRWGNKTKLRIEEIAPSSGQTLSHFSFPLGMTAQCPVPA